MVKYFNKSYKLPYKEDPYGDIWLVGPSSVTGDKKNTILNKKLGIGVKSKQK